MNKYKLILSVSLLAVTVVAQAKPWCHGAEVDNCVKINQQYKCNKHYSWFNVNGDNDGGKSYHQCYWFAATCHAEIPSIHHCKRRESAAS